MDLNTQNLSWQVIEQIKTYLFWFMESPFMGNCGSSYVFSFEFVCMDKVFFIDISNLNLRQISIF